MSSELTLCLHSQIVSKQQRSVTDLHAGRFFVFVCLSAAWHILYLWFVVDASYMNTLTCGQGLCLLIIRYNTITDLIQFSLKGYFTQK